VNGGKAGAAIFHAYRGCLFNASYQRSRAGEMITCFIGTRAQLIKMAPIVLEIERRKIPLNLVFTGQHRETMDQIVDDFGIVTKPRFLYVGKEITGIVQMAIWFCVGFYNAIRRAKYFIPRPKDERNTILVHGDTFSTLLGALLGRVLNVDVAHIEAGLRSHNIFHPFPEELTRLAVFRLSRFSFCPGEWACKNMAAYSSKIIDTHGNTLRDALELMMDFPRRISRPYDNDYGIASIHRFENVFNKARLEEIVALVETAALHFPIAFVLHPSTRKKLTQFHLLERLEKNANIRLLPRMGYADFVQLMKTAKFVITDGGGNQEELSYLGIPTLLMRKATERQEGIGTTAILCNYDETVLIDFMVSLQSLARNDIAVPSEAESATALIVNELEIYARKTA
jgi:UDP-N-acetylglucosamine 2-epimerase (non-hydrolysing)